MAKVRLMGKDATRRGGSGATESAGSAAIRCREQRHRESQTKLDEQGELSRRKDELTFITRQRKQVHWSARAVLRVPLRRAGEQCGGTER